MNTSRQEMIRNFAIIAHIDHGKTTLTDALLKQTGTIAADAKERFLDSNPIEKERGITIKLAPAHMEVRKEEKTYILNLIDTPGHVDFSYEVSRSLAACEGAILLVDASQGIQAQTLAHATQAVDLGLVLIPAINKIDLATTRIHDCQKQIQEIFGYRKEEITLISAKTAAGVEILLNRVIEDVPAPRGKENRPFRALVFNSMFDQHLGVIAWIRVIDGSVKTGDPLYLIHTQETLSVLEMGIFTPIRRKSDALGTGEVGYLATGLKDIHILRVGDTVISASQKGNVEPLPGFNEPKPMVYMDLFPAQGHTAAQLRTSGEKLQMVDSALTLRPIHSPILGSGLRLGVLGLLHGEIARERLEREGKVKTIPTKPTVEFTVEKRNGVKVSVRHASEMPSRSEINKIQEPTVKLAIVTPTSALGPLMQLMKDRRGTYLNTHYLSDRAELIYRIPLRVLVEGLVSEVKSISNGFATLDYAVDGEEPVDAVRLIVLVNHQEVEALSQIVERQESLRVARELAIKLKHYLPRQQFAVPIQVSEEGRIIARETLPAFRKDVTARLYGGDQTRKDKLLKKQKKGKRLLQKISKVTIPPETFMKMMER